MQTPTHFFATTEIVVVGTHLEAADYDNPRGEIFRCAGHVVAEDAKGYRVRLHIKTGLQHEIVSCISEIAERLNVRLAQGKLPVGFASWQEARPCYGSEAFYESGQEEEDWMLERAEDLEGAF